MIGVRRASTVAAGADDTDGTDRRRGRGEHGSAIVTALVLIFAFTAGGVIWLSRDVNRRVSNRSAAQSIAFQAARSGAQQIVVDDLRGGEVNLIIDVGRAEEESARAANRLFDSYDVDGAVTSVSVQGPAVTVRVVIRDPAGDVTGVGTAQAESG